MYPNMFNGQYDPIDLTSNNISPGINYGMVVEDEVTSGNFVALPREEQTPTQHRQGKPIHRHSPYQIKTLEAFFKDCPHPDDKQRKALARELGMEPLQVKFWFQNKRTQMKAHNERTEMAQLRIDNERLDRENTRMTEALNNALCLNCLNKSSSGEVSSKEHKLRVENARLREELAKYVGVGHPMVLNPLPSPIAPGGLELGDEVVQTSPAGEIYGGGSLPRSLNGFTDREKITELAVASMIELMNMVHLGEPLWVLSRDGSYEILNVDEYMRTFTRGIGAKPYGFKTEASRCTADINMNNVNLIEILTNVDKWRGIFSGIVSTAMTKKILSTGVDGIDGAMQMITAEFQVPSPLVPTRETKFLRYSRKHLDGSWAMVDVTLDHLHPGSTLKCLKRPSGCLIQEMPNGFSKVIWVEHVEVADTAIHSLYQPLVNSTLAFGAKHWLATLDRQSERLASVMASSFSFPGAAIISLEGRKGMLNLSEEMVMSFSSGVSASTTHTWTTLARCGTENLSVMITSNAHDQGKPIGNVLKAATSIWLPLPPKRVFDFLRDVNSRTQWDILSNGGVVEELAHFANGRDPRNRVSLLRVCHGGNSTQSNMLILQESGTSATESFVIYAPVDVAAITTIWNGGRPDYVPLVPSGFVILPDGNPIHGGGIVEVGPDGGCLLTVSFQILVDPIHAEKFTLGSVTTINTIISSTIERIKAAIARNNA